jgi:hypothetical protein
VNTVVQALLYFVVDLRAKSGQTSERGLDVPARAAEAVVKIEMAKGGIEIVAPHQTDDAPAKPNTFRVSRRTVDRLRRLNEFVGLALAVFAGIGRIGGRLAGLILGRVSALGGRASDTRASDTRASDTDEKCNRGDGKVTQNRSLKLYRPLTHKSVPARVLPGTRWFDAVQIGLQCGGDGFTDSMTDISDFVQQTHNFIVFW